jgi:hypothetical protein
MSAMPWGTMNGWLRIETEQRGAWLQQRVQDLRAAQVVRQSETAGELLTWVAAQPQRRAVAECAEPQAEAA